VWQTCIKNSFIIQRTQNIWWFPFIVRYVSHNDDKSLTGKQYFKFVTCGILLHIRNHMSFARRETRASHFTRHSVNIRDTVANGLEQLWTWRHQMRLSLLWAVTITSSDDLSVSAVAINDSQSYWGVLRDFHSVEAEIEEGENYKL